jgi:hypothetical protein
MPCSSPDARFEHLHELPLTRTIHRLVERRVTKTSGFSDPRRMSAETIP